MKIKKYQKGGKTYYKFNVYLGKDPLTGKEIRTNRQGFKSPKQAENAYLKLRTQISSKTRHPEIKTYKDAYEIWYEAWQGTVKESTILKITGIFKNHILPLIGDIKLKEFNQLQAQTFINEVSKNYKDIKGLRIYAKTVLNYVKDLGIISVNPLDKVKLPNRNKKEIKVKKRNYYTPEELKNFLDIAKEDCSLQDYTFFRLLSHTGMRLGEAIALEWSDVNFKTNYITINKSLSKSKTGKPIISSTKNGHERKIKIDQDTMDNLKELKKVNKTHVFERSGKMVSSSYPLKKLNQIIEKHGLYKITVHGLRHTHATILLRMGKSIKYIQDRLGHLDSSITLNTYSHTLLDEKEETPDEFSSFLEA